MIYTEGTQYKVKFYTDETGKSPALEYNSTSCFFEKNEENAKIRNKKS